MEGVYIERINDLNNEIGLLNFLGLLAVKTKEGIISEQRMKINEIQRKIDD